MIGQKLSPTLKEIEETLWEYEYRHPNTPPMYTDDGMIGACKIAMSAMLDRMWRLQQCEKINKESRESMAEALGNHFRQMLITYCDFDPAEYYKKEFDGTDKRNT